MENKYSIALVGGLSISVIIIVLIWTNLQKPPEPQNVVGSEIEIVNIIVNDSLYGNNDGVLNPNETVGLRFVIRNLSDAPIPASEGIIESNQQGIVILDSTALFPAIPAGSIVTAEEEFMCFVESSAAQGNAIFFLKLDAGDLVFTAFRALDVLHNIFACIARTRLFPASRSGARDTLKIRLSICNQLTLPTQPYNPVQYVSIDDVAVVIPADTIRSCVADTAIDARPLFMTVPCGFPNTIPLNEIFYGTIAKRYCQDPAFPCRNMTSSGCPLLPVHIYDFEFSVKPGELTQNSCIRFIAEIWSNSIVDSSTCRISRNNHEYTIDVFSRISN